MFHESDGLKPFNTFKYWLQVNAEASQELLNKNLPTSHTSLPHNRCWSLLCEQMQEKWRAHWSVPKSPQRRDTLIGPVTCNTSNQHQHNSCGKWAAMLVHAWLTVRSCCCRAKRCPWKMSQLLLCKLDGEEALQTRCVTVFHLCLECEKKQSLTAPPICRRKKLQTPKISSGEDLSGLTNANAKRSIFWMQRPWTQGLSGCSKRSAAKGVRSLFFAFGTLLATFRSLFLMLLSLFSSLFCQTPFAGLLLRQGDPLHEGNPSIARNNRNAGFWTLSFYHLRWAKSPIASDFGSRTQIAALFAILLYPNV